MRDVIPMQRTAMLYHNVCWASFLVSYMQRFPLP